MYRKSLPGADTGPARAVTKEDVARAAGVSHITVSRVLNTPDKVAPATRENVQLHIARMGYIPNLLAGSLASRRTRVIAAVVPTIGHSIFAETVRGMSDYLMAHDYQLLLGQSNYSEEIETELVEVFIGRRVDGVVLTGVEHTPATRRRLKSAGIPVVETWDLTADPIDMLAGFSNLDAGAAMGEYLVKQGYRRIAFVGGEDPRGVARLTGLIAALRSHRVRAPIRITVSPGSFLQGGREAMVRLLTTHVGIDAVFFSNDVIAAGAILECNRRNIRIPQDIAIAGFADLDIASEINPPLTTVHVSSHLIGKTAAQMMLSRLAGIEGRQINPISDLGFSIVRRASA
jgi:LacI family gluconate utilization system Gnt-I transcriptional repressor